MEHPAIILGCAPSLVTTGICILKGGSIEHTEVIKITKTPIDNLMRAERVYKITKKICEIIREWKVDVIGIEQQYYIAGRKEVVVSVLELIGAIKFGVYIKFQKAVVTLTIAEIRKLTLDKAFRQDKVDIEVEKRLLPAFDDVNKRDAFLTAKATEILRQKGERRVKCLKFIS